MFLQSCGEGCTVGGNLGTHRPHHRQGVDAGGGRQGKQLLRHRAGFREQLLGVDETVEEAELVKPLGAEAEGERHFCRDGMGNVRQEAVLIAAQQPALRLRHLEDGPPCGEAEIASLDEPEAAAHRVAVDRSDHRLVQRAGHEWIVDAGRQPRRAALDGLLHVFPGAKGAAGAGEDRDFVGGAIAELPPGVRERHAQLDAQRIQTIRPVHPNHHDRTVAVNLDDRHRSTPPTACRSGADPEHTR